MRVFDILLFSLLAAAAAGTAATLGKYPEPHARFASVTQTSLCMIMVC
jgi:hypothetical protein